jgi:hypothetical protein
MGRLTPLIDATLESALERSESLRRELVRVSRRRYPPGAAESILTLAADATERLASALESLAGDQELRELLDEPQFVLKVYRYAKYFNLLHGLLGYLEGADIDSTPAAIIPPLRRFVQHTVKGAEILLSARAELNYSVVDIGPNLRRAFSHSEFEDLLAHFPASLIVISFPSVEANNVFLHGIVAHEIGHSI